MLKEGLRILLTLISASMVLLFLASIALGCHLYFEVPMNMEPLIVDYSTGQPVLRAVESPHPYTPSWTDRLVLRVPYARLKFENITLEKGDLLVVEQVGTAKRWVYGLNGTDVLTSTFSSGLPGSCTDSSRRVSFPVNRLKELPCTATSPPMR